MTVWFTSDLHLGHERINELAGRPFSSREEADAALVELWNERVRPGDAVFVLGDIAMGKLEESLALVSTLHGVKFLVPGNHDRVSHLYRGSAAKKEQWAAQYKAAGLVTLAEEFVIPFLGIGEVLLCHFPYEGDSHDEDRYAEARPLDTGRWLLHGHTHSSDRVRGRQVHVGVDAWGYAPVALEDLLSAMLENLDEKGVQTA